MSYCLISVAWKSLHNIKGVVDDASNSTLKPSETVVVINPYNDQDTTEIRNYVKSDSRITRWIDCSQNIGCATAWNVALHSNNCEYCIVVNDDCRVGHTTYENMMASLVQDRVGMVGVDLGGFDGDKVKTPKGFLFGVRKKVILEIGGFREIASPLADEVEFGLRVASVGYSVTKAENCSWEHVHDISSNPNQPVKYLGNYINVRKRQLEVEPFLKFLQQAYNNKIS
jgi:GT2 family glycosyltransferase